MEGTERPSPRVVLTVLAATFALGTIVWVVMFQPDRAGAIKGGLTFVAMGLFFFGWARLSAAILRGSDDGMSTYSKEYFESFAEFLPVVATAMVPCGVVLLLSAPWRP